MSEIVSNHRVLWKCEKYKIIVIVRDLTSEELGIGSGKIYIVRLTSSDNFVMQSSFMLTIEQHNLQTDVPELEKEHAKIVLLTYKKQCEGFLQLYKTVEL